MFLCPMCRQVANLEASVSSDNLLVGLSADQDDSGTEAEEERPLDLTLRAQAHHVETFVQDMDI